MKTDARKVTAPYNVAAPRWQYDLANPIFYFRIRPQGRNAKTANYYLLIQKETNNTQNVHCGQCPIRIWKTIPAILP